MFEKIKELKREYNKRQEEKETEKYRRIAEQNRKLKIESDNMKLKMGIIKKNTELKKDIKKCKEEMRPKWVTDLLNGIKKRITKFAGNARKAKKKPKRKITLFNRGNEFLKRGEIEKVELNPVMPRRKEEQWGDL
ncbi:MAG: hypothetical protein U9Q97_01115 [Acidobacteriota bacterium]|nr:hypothetical protein [Acidobacteriota bacterium]